MNKVEVSGWGLAVVLAFTGCATTNNAECGLRTVESRQTPVSIVTNGHGRIFVDFGKDAFGWLELLPPEGCEGGAYKLALGELKLEDDTVDLRPGAEIRSELSEGVLSIGFGGSCRVELEPNPRNTAYARKVPPVRMRDEIGVVLPFRYVEFFKVPFEITKDRVRRVMVHYPIDMEESSFVCSDCRLTQVYDFCKYSILATSFAGLYVDGDRERIPYEADAYINQLGNYAISSDGRLARATHEYLLRHPTWPTEWKQHSIMMAWADWMWTGESTSIKGCYEILRREKLFLDNTREDWLVRSQPEAIGGPCAGDIIDWPPCDRDGYVFCDASAVVNAFHYRNLNEMAQIAKALGKVDDVADFTTRAEKVRASYLRVFRDPEDGLYCDGDGTRHKGLHANVAALAFGLVPECDRRMVADWIAMRGMKCSVYFAQYLLEALFEGGRADAALALMTSDKGRSWLNMMRQGSTITMEAWDLYDKQNLDWNHAWGTPPLNIISRYILGVTPLEPGFTRALVKPCPAGLCYMNGIVPTIRGKIGVKLQNGVLTVRTPVPSRVIWNDKIHDVEPGEVKIR